MSRRNKIVINPDPKGNKIEGFVAAGQTFYPGMAVVIDPTVALKNGRHTWKYFAPGSDGALPGGPICIVQENYLLGKQLSDSYAAGERFFGYCPLPGDELNLLLADVAGTADDHAAGEVLIIKNASGKFIATTGSPAQKPATLLETITDPVADTLAWCIWNQ